MGHAAALAGRVRGPCPDLVPPCRGGPVSVLNEAAAKDRFAAVGIGFFAIAWVFNALKGRV